MKFWKSAEWQRIGKLRGLKLLLLGITLIPSIYAVIFLSSLWDAYGNVNNLPVAVVNQDQSAKINGKNQHLGSDLADKLVKEQPLKISEVSNKKAQDGLKQGKYYMTITIPSDFTKNAGTLLSDQPITSKIKISHNAGASFIAEKMTSSAADKIQTSVTRSLQKVYNETILSATKSSQKGLQAGSDGASKLNNGVGQLSDGTKKLNDGAESLTSGTSTLAQGVSQYTNGVSQVNNGANQLAGGANSAATGANQLASGTSQLAQNTPQLEAGSQQLAAGAQQLASQLQKISEQIDTQQKAKVGDLEKLDAGLAELTNKLSQLQAGTSDIGLNSQDLVTKGQKLTTGLTAAGKNAGQIASVLQNERLKTFLKANPDLAQQLGTAPDDLEKNLTESGQVANGLNTELGEALTKLKDTQAQLTKEGLDFQRGAQATEGARQAIKQLNDSLTTISTGLSQQAVPGAQKLADGAATLNAGQKQVTAASSQLSNGASQLARGNSQLATGTSQLNSGLGQLASKGGALNNGAGQLTQGAQQLATGTSQAASALGQVQNGTATLAAKLADGAIQLNAVHNNKGNVTALTQPVKSSQNNLSHVANNGTGMAPYMMSVGLFVGMITLSTIYDFMTVAKKPRSGFAWWADKQTVNFPVWIGQALVMTTLLILIDGLNAARPVMVFVVALAAAFSFNQLVLFFNVLLGKLGSGIMLILMVLQLSASAGSYPIELSNEFFRAVHPWMPMTYSVHAFRETISIGGSVATDLTVLLSVGMISMVLTWGVYHWKLQHNQMLWAD
ncbi:MULTISPECIES: YhgE/Pip domain-containing protein [Leuconostoc]|uniref:YhgE/Pip domain-containing protein n=1 Tax=Leuconostoc kimchii TaxID=136609 RepID=A0ABX5SK38_9LACO|nr:MULTISPECIES: YhgE/Pip domain-containing protein [Leuconostoc]AEJ31705.1 integral membrane protein [Leuconostoc sp. C2]QBR46853.1 YhgE/Pip domain-containing protein [Leuconostoc kimchii]